MNYKKRQFAHYREHRSCLYINDSETISIWKCVHILLVKGGAKFVHEA